MRDKYLELKIAIKANAVTPIEIRSVRKDHKFLDEAVAPILCALERRTRFE